jgi:diadenosine tetraphosphatase ApaH/serine/threonine PP2A family protein phosphatase
MTEPQAADVVDVTAERLLMNPGSVGQPRNGDPRAHYAVLDTEAQILTFGRVEYPITLTQARMRDLDFPARLIHRLAEGY